MILILNPPNPAGRVSNKEMMGGFGQCYPIECEVKIPPMDIVYSASVLKEANAEFEVIDCLGLGYSLDDLMEKIKSINYAYVCIRTSTSTFSYDSCVAGKIKESKNCKIVFFGPHVNVFPEEILNTPYVDAVVIGEPELTLKELSGQGFKNTGGLWYKENGTIFKNQPRENIADIDSLPFPAWELMPYEEYKIGSLMPEGITLFMLTSRGCPYACDYCPYPVAQGTIYRKRSSKSVIDEMTYLASKFNVKNILFRDAEFTLDKNRVREICEGIVSSKINVKWRCETRIDTLDEELLEIMAKANCVGINMGIESSNEEVICSVGRKVISKEKTINVMRKCRELGIHTFCFYIIGLPKDTINSVIETMEYAIQLDADVSQFTIATPYPGTKLYKWAVEKNYIEQFENDKITGFESLIRNENLTSKEILKLREEVQRKTDLMKKNKIQEKEEVISVKQKIFSILLNFYLRIFRLSGIKNIIIYGMKGFSVSKIKKMGFNVLGIVEKDHFAEKIEGLTVLPPIFILSLKPQAVIVSLSKRGIDLKESAKGIKIIEPFKTLKFLKDLIFKRKDKL